MMQTDDQLRPPRPSLRQRIREFGMGMHYTIRKPHFLVVLGMHRSGTSFVTKTLNLLGVSFGQTIVDQVAPDNGEIHWESPASVWINDEILGRSGGTWESPPQDIRPHWRDLWRCRRFLWNYASCRLCVYKDPRLLLTYNVWRQVLPQHTIIACVRNPQSVAQSLAKRDGMSIEQGLQLWAAYNKHLLEYSTSGTPIIWVDFDQGRTAAHRLVHQVCHRFKLPPTREALEHYNADSHHHLNISELPDDTASLYSELRQKIDEEAHVPVTGN